MLIGKTICSFLISGAFLGLPGALLAQESLTNQPRTEPVQSEGDVNTTPTATTDEEVRSGRIISLEESKDQNTSLSGIKLERPEVDISPQIRELLDRYRAQADDYVERLAELKKIWPTLTEEQRQKLRETFRSLLERHRAQLLEKRKEFIERRRELMNKIPSQREIFDQMRDQVLDQTRDIRKRRGED